MADEPYDKIAGPNLMESEMDREPDDAKIGAMAEAIGAILHNNYDQDVYIALLGVLADYVADGACCASHALQDVEEISEDLKMAVSAYFGTGHKDEPRLMN